MNETLTLVLAWMAGAALGLLFFGGLWWTVRKGVLSSQPAIWFFVSVMLRMSIALGGFYLVGGAHWDRMIACLLGFIMARPAVTWLTRMREIPSPSGGVVASAATESHSSATVRPIQPTREPNHAHQSR